MLAQTGLRTLQGLLALQGAKSRTGLLVGGGGGATVLQLNGMTLQLNGQDLTLGA